MTTAGAGPMSAHPVGREAELADLQAWMARGRDRSPATVVVAGEAGIGKTTLVTEFGHRLGDVTEVLTGRCHELGGDAVPWAPLVEVVRQLVGLHGVGDVLELAGPCHGELARLVPVLGPTSTDSFGAGHARLTDALTSLLRRVADRTPLVLVLEDLHWADPSTLDLLPAVVRALGDRAAMVVITLRWDELADGAPARRLSTELVRSGRGRILQVGPLTRGEQARQLTGILGVPPSRRVLDEVWARAAGNPFFAEELVAHDGDDLPVTIHELLVGRLVALPRPTRLLLTTAAVSGGAVDADLLGAVLDLDADSMAVGLEPAVAAHVLVRAGPRLLFRHALVAEVAARMLLPTEAVRVHGRIADALEGGLGGAEPAERAAAIARHRLAAGEPGPALSASVLAARATTSLLAFPDALRHYERALGLWDRVEDPAGLVGCRLDALLGSAAEVAHLAAVPDRAAALARAALAQVDERDDPVRAGLLHERLGRYLWMAAEGRTATGAYERAVELVPALPPSEARARVLSGWSQMLMLSSRFDEALAAAQEAIEVAAAVGARSVEGHARNNRGIARAYLGDVDAGLADLEEAGRIAEDLLDDVDDVLRAVVNRVAVLFDTGRLEEAAEVALEAVAVAERLGLARRKGTWARCDAAESLVAVGRLAQAQVLVDEAVGQDPAGIDLVRTRLVQGWLALEDDRLEDARQALEEGATLGHEVIDPQLVAPLATAMTDLRIRQGRPGEGVAVAANAWDTLVARDPAFTVRLAATATAAAVDAVLAGGGSGAVADRWLARAEGAGEDHAVLPHARAWVDRARAEHTRLGTTPCPPAWDRSATGWDRLGARLRAGHDRWRQAEALVSGGGSREEARAAALLADRACAEAGATWLGARVRDFARRARLDLDDRGRRSVADAGLTPREHDVLALVAEGLTNRQIGERLFIGHRTVATHVSNLLAKLSATSRSEAAAIAVRDGLLA